jgi:hypothetical protein
MRSDRLVRALTCYDRSGEYVGERVLAVPTTQLCDLFGLDRSDEMHGAYAVGDRQAEALSRILGEPLDLESYAWFVESYTIDED